MRLRRVSAIILEAHLPPKPVQICHFMFSGRADLDALLIAAISMTNQPSLPGMEKPPPADQHNEQRRPISSPNTDSRTSGIC